MTDKERDKKDRIKLQKQFGQHLRGIRIEKGIKPVELARRCFMERSSIARLEMGRTMPTIFIVKKLCTALEIELKDFFKDF
jgi:transcriptional regulator with XRE-family HTH domain